MPANRDNTANATIEADENGRYVRLSVHPRRDGAYLNVADMENHEYVRALGQTLIELADDLRDYDKEEEWG